MSKKKHTRKQQIAEDTADDQFLMEAHRFADWTEKHLRQLALGCLGIAMLIGGILFAGSSADRASSVTTADFTKAVAVYRDATELQKTITSTQPEQLIDDAKKAIPAFEAIIAADDGSANLARLYAADLARRVGEHDKAETLYKAFLKTAPKNDIARFVALEGAGYAAEEQGKLDEALAHFTQLTQLPRDFYQDYGFKHVGRIHELKKDTEKALQAYKTLIEKMPDSTLKDFADGRIAALE
jgi:tetratricopeptide (TPR) repeat protein